MEELLNVLKIFVELKYFIVQHKPDPDSPSHYIFTLTPVDTTEFNDPFNKLLATHFPQEIFWEILPSSIEFRATKDSQDNLVDVFCEILRLSLRDALNSDDFTFLELLKVWEDEKPFARILEKYNKAEVAECEEKPLEVAVPEEIAISEPEVTVDDAGLIEAPTLLPLPSTQITSSFYFTASGRYPGQLPKPGKEEKLNWGLQSDLSNIVSLMDESTEPPTPRHLLDFWGGLKNLAQQTKNTLNPIIGDADAAINMKEKLRAYSKVVSRHYNYLEIQDITELVNSRLLHVQQYHLKDAHQEEIAFLTSGEKRARDIRECMRQRGAIPQPGSGAPSTLA